MGKTVGRILLPAMAVVALLTITALPAAAHSGSQTYLYVDVTDTSLSGRIEAPVPDMARALGLDATDDGAGFIGANQDAIVAYLAEHMEFTVDGVEWPETFDSAFLFYSDLPEADDNYLVVPFTVSVLSDDDTVPRSFDLLFDPFVEEIPGRSSLLLIANDWRGGVIDNGYDSLTAFDAGSRAQVIDLGEGSWFKNLTASVKLGVDHIRTGPDHVLFVLVLLLPAVLVFNRRWWPTDGFGSSLWRVLKIVTMFTVAHSITFTLAGLDLLPLPPSKLVEFIIALSIAAAALHNIRPLLPNREWLLSFSFGLFHGMGFATLVEGLDVPRSVQLVSLLGRNLGIEIGQAAVVILLFPALFLLRRTRFYQPFFMVASVVMAAISLVWMVERLAETDLGISAVIDPLFASAPTLAAAVIGLTAVSLGLHRMEDRPGRLLPVHGSDSRTIGPRSGAAAEGSGLSVEEVMGEHVG
ncbi:MAG: HupE/UreJ family protein [Acidimicrobiia bacterium]|nr:HupE/UreJ family protein [Acidimicrobiia bacterium]